MYQDFIFPKYLTLEYNILYIVVYYKVLFYKRYIGYNYSVINSSEYKMKTKKKSDYI